MLADAVRLLRASGDMTPLICAGDGPLRPVLESLARDVPGVTLVGWLSPDDLTARMSTALALLVPSVVAEDGDSEGLPSVVPEAMARGNVVIGTHEGGIAEAVTDGITGLLVPPGDAAELAAAMHRLTKESALAARLALSAFSAVSERLNAHLQSAALETILLKAAGLGLSATMISDETTLPAAPGLRVHSD